MQVLGGRLLLGRREVLATCLTTAHARTLSGLATIAALGVPHLALVDPDPASAATLLARHRPTLIETFPNVFTRWEVLAEDPTGPLANVRIFLSTFDAAHPRTIHTMLRASSRRLPVYAQAYAQSETGAIALSFRLSQRRRGDARHVGWPALAFNRIRLVNPDTGTPLRRPGETGAIEVRGPGLFAGYHGEPERTQSGWHDGWWRTGDLGTRGIHGALRLHGRVVDAVTEIPDYLAREDVLLDRLDELDELLILDDPHGHPVAVATTRGDRPIDPARWAAATADLPALAPPRLLRWEQLPTTATWKVRRPALRQQLFGNANP
ncbi:AMP-binding enzyme [Modestobacter sp. DSM 44400]|uniref:AMP-binding protein n=1 Tax=Modestobacter sp. DSM 44400 TaxID=1550230 RepID=UPI00089A01B1|nr:AMP-binding protein [Modestobacter sp. DSM 44400]SDY83214.1 AMP-binding enzyme [Modestobacter sp. DSM 44400]